MDINILYEDEEVIVGSLTVEYLKKLSQVA